VLTASRPIRAAVAGVLLASALAASSLAPTLARAETSSQATAQVRALVHRVHALHLRAKAAERRYRAAFAAVADSVNTAVSLDEASSTVKVRAEDANAQMITRVRGLYESGGQLDADAAMLESGSITEFYNRSVLASHAMSVQVAYALAASERAQRAAAVASAAARRSRRTIGTERDVQGAAVRVETLLAKQKDLLAKANKHLAAIRKAEQALAAENSDFSAITTTSVAGLHILPPSAQYLALYREAATTCHGLSWTVLAAIGQVESGHGRNTSTSSAGAMGPMQFEPATFRAYAVDGDHDGEANIMDPADAIYTAAHYLCANGAGYGPNALTRAILHYNHAIWYVDMVETLARDYASAYS